MCHHLFIPLLEESRVAHDQTETRPRRSKVGWSGTRAVEFTESCRKIDRRTDGWVWRRVANGNRAAALGLPRFKLNSCSRALHLTVRPKICPFQ